MKAVLKQNVSSSLFVRLVVGVIMEISDSSIERCLCTQCYTQGAKIKNQAYHCLKQFVPGRKENVQQFAETGRLGTAMKKEEKAQSESPNYQKYSNLG